MRNHLNLVWPLVLPATPAGVRAVVGAWSLVVVLGTPVASQTANGSSARDYLAPPVSDAGKVAGTAGRLEITVLSRARFRGTIIIQMTRPGAERSDAFALYLAHPSYPDDPTSGLYCYISRDGGEGFKQAFISDEALIAREPIRDDAAKQMQELAEQVEIATSGLTTDKIGLGVLRSLPDSLFGALDRVVSASGGCGWSTAPAEKPTAPSTTTLAEHLLP
jgi:hypothetical protein